MGVRRPAVAGSFYPANAEDLKGAIRKSYLHKLGPGRLPSSGTIAHGMIKACVCPHAGYVYSGATAAHSYLDVSELKSPGLVVIVGPNHYGVGSGVATYGEGEWETPLGKVVVDHDATKRLLKLSGIVEVDPGAHSREHSIEVQLPFLQALYGSFRFLPISLAFQDKITAIELGKGLAKLLKEVTEGGGRNAVLIASSDLTHYEPTNQAREKDMALLGCVQKLDLTAFYTTLETKNISACGYGAIATVMEACSWLGLRKARINAYATSGDVLGNEAVVGYPSVSFHKA